MAYEYKGYTTNPPKSMESERNVLPYLTALTGVAGAFGEYERGRTRRVISESNAEIAELQAKMAKRQGGEREGRSRLRIKKLIGKQRAALAAQGVSLEGGSAQDVMRETREIGELDALTIRLNAAREAFGFEEAAKSARFEGKMAERAGRSAALQSLLSGGLRAYEQYKRG